MSTITDAATLVNGVNVDQLVGTINAIRENPSLARFKFRTETEWIEGGHCRTAITSEVEKIAGVTSVDVDLDAKRVIVAGENLDDAAVRAAIDEADYDVA